MNVIKLMKDKKMILSWILIILLSLFLMIIITKTFSRYESSVDATASVKYAYYLLESDYQVNSVFLDGIIPSNEPYVYTFSISNYNEFKRLEVDLEYDLIVETTTNLPLEYSLYLNENYTDSDATNIILQDEIYQDSYGTYFRKMTTSKQYFSYVENESNIYTLVIYFPIEYIDSAYQDIVESVDIIIDSRQVIE